MIDNVDFSFINEKLEYVQKNYNPEHQAIGLAFETESTVHIERHIISYIIILKFKDSSFPSDILAVAIAYTREGARHRKEAISYFERFFNNYQRLPYMPHGAYHGGTNLSEYQKRTVYGDWYLHSMLSELYEKEYDFENAIKQLELCIESCGGDCNADFIRIGDILIKLDLNRAKAYYDDLKESDVYPMHKYAIDVAYEKLNEKIASGYIYKPRKSKISPELSEDELFYIETAKQFI